MPVYTAGTEVKPSDIAKQGLQEARKNKVDVVIVDTAGRLQVLIIFRAKNTWMVHNNIVLIEDSLPIIYYTHLKIEQIDKAMMDELKEVKRAINPTEVLLVVDAMTGQEAAGTSFSNLGRPQVLKPFF